LNVLSSLVFPCAHLASHLWSCFFETELFLSFPWEVNLSNPWANVNPEKKSQMWKKPSLITEKFLRIMYLKNRIGLFKLKELLIIDKSISINLLFFISRTENLSSFNLKSVNQNNTKFIPVFLFSTILVSECVTTFSSKFI